MDNAEGSGSGSGLDQNNGQQNSFYGMDKEVDQAVYDILNQGECKTYTSFLLYRRLV